MKILFLIKKRANPYCKIYVRLWQSKTYDFTASTGMQINCEFWSATNQKVKNKVDATDKDFINSKLMDLRKYITESYNVEYNTGLSIATHWLKNKVDIFFNRVNENQPHKTYFTDWIKIFIDNANKRLHKGKTITNSTIKKYTTTLNNLLAYEATTGKKLRFEEVTLNFYFDFVDYCRNTQKLGINTIGTRVKVVKLFCKQIDLDGLPISQQYKHPEFVAQAEQATDIYLTNSEIDKLFNLNLNNDLRLDNTRDLLIIGLNTGLRVSDFMRLDISHIQEDTIRIKAKKTGKTAEIPINTQIAETLKKRNGNLPHAISEQKFNQYIKELGRLVGFNDTVQGAKMDSETKRKVKGTFKKWELMTSHICRRSFATNLYGKIPTPTIMAITGHATETQFLTYIKKTTAENTEVLRNFYKQSANDNGLVPALKIVS